MNDSFEYIVNRNRTYRNILEEIAQKTRIPLEQYKELYPTHENLEELQLFKKYLDTLTTKDLKALYEIFKNNYSAKSLKSLFDKFPNPKDFQIFVERANISSKNETANPLPLVNYDKSIGNTKIPCNNTHEIAKTAIIFGKYLADDCIRSFKNFRNQTGLNICQLLIFSSVLTFGMTTMLLELPIAFFLEYSIAPSIIVGLIDQIVNPDARKVYTEKFKDLINSNQNQNEYSGRRH